MYNHDIKAFKPSLPLNQVKEGRTVSSGRFCYGVIFRSWDYCISQKADKPGASLSRGLHYVLRMGGGAKKKKTYGIIRSVKNNYSRCALLNINQYGDMLKL